MAASDSEFSFGFFFPLFFPNPIAKVGRRGPGQAVSALVPLRKGCAQGSAELKNCWVTRLLHTTDRRLLSLSAELSSSFLALSPVLSPSGRLSAELLFSFLAHSPLLLADDDDCDDHTKDRPASGSFPHPPPFPNPISQVGTWGPG